MWLVLKSSLENVLHLNIFNTGSLKRNEANDSIGLIQYIGVHLNYVINILWSLLT